MLCHGVYNRHTTPAVGLRMLTHIDTLSVCCLRWQMCVSRAPRPAAVLTRKFDIAAVTACEMARTLFKTSARSVCYCTVDNMSCTCVSGPVVTCRCVHSMKLSHCGKQIPASPTADVLHVPGSCGLPLHSISRDRTQEAHISYPKPKLNLTNVLTRHWVVSAATAVLAATASLGQPLPPGVSWRSLKQLPVCGLFQLAAACEVSHNSCSHT
jgi:hypothetical protein